MTLDILYAAAKQHVIDKGEYTSPNDARNVLLAYIAENGGGLPSDGLLPDNQDPTITSIDWFNRVLQAANGNYVLDWANYQIFDSNETELVNFSSGFKITGAGAASKAALALTGAILTGGTGTTNFPHLFIQPSGATAATSWSTSGTLFGANAATGFTGCFVDFKIAGASASKAKINYSGDLDMAGKIGGTGLSVGTAAGDGPVSSATAAVGQVCLYTGGTQRNAFIAGYGLVLDSGSFIRWTTSANSQGTVGITHGPVTGSPEGAVTAPIGSTRYRLDGGAGTTFYVKESGTGNTGWVAK